MAKKKVLVVDDEAKLRRLVSSYLTEAGYIAIEAQDGASALKLARSEQPALVVLDLMLPEIDGLEVCHILRRELNPFIIILTAKSQAVHKLVGLEMGADDYLTKPFSPKELVARVRAILRRSPSGEPDCDDETLSFGDIEVDQNRRLVKRDGQIVELTYREFSILAALMSRPGMVYSREILLEQIWGYDHFGDTHVVDVHVANLRKKLEAEPARPRLILTVRGLGYKFATTP